MPLRVRRARQRGVAAATGLVLLLGFLMMVIRADRGVQAAAVPVPGEIAFSRSLPAPSSPPSAPPSIEPGPPEIPRIAALAAPEQTTHLSRVVAAPPYQAAAPFADPATGDEFEPAWSPDGNRIAYTCAEPDSPRTVICVADSDGGNAREVTDPPLRAGVAQDDGEPAWSPDGSRLAFTRELVWVIEGPSGSAVLTVPADGAEGDTAAVVDTGGVWASHPTWSPDGRRIAYQHEGFEPGTERFSSRILAVAPDGTGEAVLTDGPDDADPAWSPDGRSVAYIERESEFEAGALSVLEVASGASTPLVVPADDGPNDFAAEPAWSPDSATILYTWLVSSSDTGDIRAVPAAGGPQTTVVAGLTDDRHPTWRPTADLHVTVAAPDPLLFGQPGTLVVTVTNGGPAPARAAQLDVRLPADFAASAVLPASCVLDAARVTCALGDLPAGVSVTVTVTGRPSTFGVVAVTAAAQSRTADLDPADNTVSARFPVLGTDLGVGTVVPVGPALLGEVVTYAVTVTRVVGNGVTGAVVDITLPDNVSFVGVDTDPATVCTPTPGGTLRCALPPLGVAGDADSATVQVRATATVLGERSGSARVTSPAFDVNPANDTSDFTTRVVGAQLAVAKQAPASAVVGQEFGYDLGVRNGGERAISGAELVDELPPGLSVIAVESAAATCTVTGTPAAVHCALPVLPATDPAEPPGAPDTVRVHLRVRATSSGPVRNAACVRVALPPAEPPEDGDPGEAVTPLQVFEDCDDVTTRVDAGDLAVAVTARPSVGYVGGQIRATVEVRNAGAATVPAAVRVQLPPTACETPVAAGCVAVTRDVTLGPLAPGATRTVAVQLVPVAAGPATVAAQVLPATFDLTDRNDRAAAVVSIRRPTLLVHPPIGPPGFVAAVRGTDFPPGATVRLVWTRGVTLTGPPVVVPSNGSFERPMLVARRDDALGPRQVVAVTSGLVEAALGLPPVGDDFLVVPGRLEPPDFAVRR